MSKLLSTYAAACGLQIGEANLKEQFYPLAFPRYLTIQTGSGQAAKNYDYWQEVIVMLKPMLDTAGITVVHLGGKDDPPLQGAHDLRGKTNVQQSYYLIKRAALHMGNDSWLAHCAGWSKIPLVAVYGSTSVANHGPYWYNPDTTVLLSSHRGGGVPTYSSQEQPKTINLIAPETIGNAVLRLLNTGPLLTQQTRLIGLIYNHPVFELVPNSFPAPTFVPNAPIVVRMDYLFNEEVLLNLLKTGRKVNIITNKALDLNMLSQFRRSILSYTHDLDASCPLQYVGALKGVIQHHSFFTKEKDEAKVADLRYRFFDVCNVERATDVSRDDYLNASLAYLNGNEAHRVDLERELGYDGVSRLMFKSNKYILSDGKVFLSMAHLKKGHSVESLGHNIGNVIDDPEYWRDINHHLIYLQP